MHHIKPIYTSTSELACNTGLRLCIYTSILHARPILRTAKLPMNSLNVAYIIACSVSFAPTYHIIIVQMLYYIQIVLCIIYIILLLY